MLLKNQASSIISTYAADVSGVCSALFEFGGMCIMHDASGCNSTYNTHDEPRWYNSDSLVFISALSETEAIMGDDRKLINDIISAGNDLKPSFIAIAGTPIPSIIGTDLSAIAAECEAALGIPAFAVPTDGMHSYIYGAGLAFKELVRRFAVDMPKTENLSVSVLGTTPLDFSVNGYVDDLYSYLSENGFEIVAKLGMGGKIEDLEKIASSHVNLVVSSCGLPAARWLYERFGTPYLTALPIKGDHAQRVADTIRQIDSGSKIMACFSFCREPADTYIIHEAVTALSLCEYLNTYRGIHASAIYPPDTDSTAEYFAGTIADSERRLTEILKNAKRVIADPLYKPICPKTAEFIPLAHEAFSGRIYRKDIPNLLKDI